MRSRHKKAMSQLSEERTGERRGFLYPKPSKNCLFSITKLLIPTK